MSVGANAGGSYLANGDISMSRAVRIDTTKTKGGYVVQCTDDTGTIVGISCQAPRNPPMEGLDDGLAAKADEPIRVYVYTEECLWQTSTTAFSAGAYLKPDGSGKATPATADGDVYIAVALESSPGDGSALIHVRVVFGAWRGA